MIAVWRRHLALALRFALRDLKDRFAGSISGALWAIIQPLIQLAVYAFVFVHIFKARLPGAGGDGFVPFLVMALWPWFAFSEAVQRGTTSIQENAALIGKVAMPRQVLVLSTVLASFAIHLTGFVLIVIALRLSGKQVSLMQLPLALLLYLPLFALAYGVALMFAAVQVFVRDLAQALPQLLMLGMFGAPIFYDRAMFPEKWRAALDLNPYTYYAESIRALLLGHGSFSIAATMTALVVAALFLLLGKWVFRRLDPHFEDFM